jgi:Phage integrase family
MRGGFGGKSYSSSVAPFHLSCKRLAILFAHRTLIRSFALGGVTQSVALAAPEITPSIDLPAAPTAFQATQPPPASAEPGGRVTESDEFIDLDRQAVATALGLPRVSFHALRHTHTSALIAAGLDVVAISRRLGHANPTVTLNVYGHLFEKDDSAAANAIEMAMRTRSEPSKL